MNTVLFQGNQEKVLFDGIVEYERNVIRCRGKTRLN